MLSAAERPVVLTSRERQVVHALAAGQSVKQTARQLNISVRTAEVYVRRIAAKLSGAGCAAGTPLVRIRMWAWSEART
jgi:DNA-binding NarL/FixJ family response regulator